MRRPDGLGTLCAARVVALALVTCALCATQAAAQTFVVNTGIDELGIDAGNGRCETAPGNGICTFRRAFFETRRIFAAEPSPLPSVTIVLDVPGGVINLVDFWESRLSGRDRQSLAGGSLAIVGAGRSSTTIEANRAVLVETAATLTISGLTIRRAGVYAVKAGGPTRLDHVSIEETQGVAFFYWGPLATLNECQFSLNLGGAIENSSFTVPARPDSGILRVRRTLFQGNRATLGGGIRAVSGTVDLDGVTFAGNHSTNSGGAISIFGASSLRAVNTTFSGNTADESGGAVFFVGHSASFDHTTFVANTADANLSGSGVGGALAVLFPWGTVGVAHSVFAANTASAWTAGGWISASDVCYGGFHGTGPNLFDLDDCLVTGEPPAIGAAHLGPLQDNGGSTPTHLPLPGSEAIDGGQTGPCVATGGTAIDRDQRGRRRLAGAACDLGAVEAGAAVVPMGARYDLNGDGRSDLLWEHMTLPWRGAWLMNGRATRGLASFPIDNPLWSLVTAADVDGDGKSDLIWRHRHTGQVGIWLMDGLAVREAGLLPTPAFGWRLAGTGDVDGDGRADLVWEQEPRGSGAAGVWFMDGTALKGFRRWPEAPGWSVAGVADANGDGTSDLLWHHTTNGRVVLWFMVNGELASGALLPSTSASGWAVAGFADLNGDRKADIVWRQEQGPGTSAWLLDGGTMLTAADFAAVSDEHWTLSQVLDTDGDGRADLIWRGANPNGPNARWRMDGLTLHAVEFLTSVPDPAWTIR